MDAPSGSWRETGPARKGDRGRKDDRDERAFTAMQRERERERKREREREKYRERDRERT
jgi:hypothetical protein